MVNKVVYIYVFYWMYIPWYLSVEIVETFPRDTA